MKKRALKSFLTMTSRILRPQSLDKTSENSSSRSRSWTYQAMTSTKMMNSAASTRHSLISSSRSSRRPSSKATTKVSSLLSKSMAYMKWMTMSSRAEYLRGWLDLDSTGKRLWRRILLNNKWWYRISIRHLLGLHWHQLLWLRLFPSKGSLNISIKTLNSLEMGSTRLIKCLLLHLYPTKWLVGMLHCLQVWLSQCWWTRPFLRLQAAICSTCKPWPPQSPRRNSWQPLSRQCIQPINPPQWDRGLPKSLNSSMIMILMRTVLFTTLELTVGRDRGRTLMRSDWFNPSLPQLEMERLKT